MEFNWRWSRCSVLVKVTAAQEAFAACSSLPLRCYSAGCRCFPLLTDDGGFLPAEQWCKGDSILRLLGLQRVVAEFNEEEESFPFSILRLEPEP